MKKLLIATLALAPLAFAGAAQAQGTARGAQRGVEDGSAHLHGEMQCQPRDTRGET
ncbi:hypothetical protein [Methylobacterium oryzae]|uniref:hypothetical protein n=1 Tax=Methylobacterium oryzae TaxID=334852 RepID=UPI002F34FC3F